MATLIPNGLAETIQDKIVEALTLTAQEQAALDPLVNFFVYKDRLIPLDDESEQFPLVNVWIQSLNSQVRSSTGKTYQQEICNYSLDCYAIGKTDTTDSPDVAGMARLKYLKEQVKHSILSLINIDFGLEAGIIAKRGWPNFQFFQPDLADTENSIPAGRWQFPVEYSYDPEDIVLEDLKLIDIKTSLWETLFQY